MKKHRLIIIIVILIIILIVAIFLAWEYKVKLSDKGSECGQLTYVYSTFISRSVIGTFLAIITIILGYFAFLNANEQSLRNGTATLLRTYSDSIKEFSFPDKTTTGRAAIAKFLEEFSKNSGIMDEFSKNVEIKDEKKILKDLFTKLDEKTGEANDNYLVDIFPTHIPSIIVSILYAIENSSFTGNRKANLFKQVKLILSFEERILLLIYVTEKLYAQWNMDKQDAKMQKDEIIKGETKEAEEDFKLISVNIFKSSNKLFHGKMASYNLLYNCLKNTNPEK